jgi:hypothetical protein
VIPFSIALNREKEKRNGLVREKDIKRAPEAKEHLIMT